MFIEIRIKCVLYAKCLIYMFEFKELLKHFSMDCNIKEGLNELMKTIGRALARLKASLERNPS